MQYRFAKIINQQEDATLLNYGFLDWGFYTAAGVAPHLKYYHLANMPLEELHSEQDRYVREGLSDFVVTRRPLSEELGEKYTYVYDRHSVRAKRGRTEIGMHSVRGGTIVGEHEAIFAGENEIVTLSHTATSREVFAAGALRAAAYMTGKSAGLYNMTDLIREHLD